MNIDVEEIMKIKEELKKASDELTNKIIEFEKELIKLNLGVEAWVEIDENVVLGYKKHEGNWSIVVRYKSKKTNGEDILVKASSAPRFIRVLCYRKRMLLIPTLKESAQHLLNSIHRVLQAE